MSVAQAIAEIGPRLQGRGFGVGQDTLDGRDVLVGRHSEFRWRWFATRLHTFVLVLDATGLDMAGADHLAGAAQRYAIDHNGG